MLDNNEMIVKTELAMIDELRKELKRLHYPLEVMLVCARWYAAYSLSPHPMLGFKSFWSAQKLISGIETLHIVKKGQLLCPDGRSISAADQFYSLLYGHHRGSASQRRHIAPTSRRQAADSKFNKQALPKSTWTPQGPGRKIRLLNTLLFSRSAYSLYEVDDALQ